MLKATDTIAAINEVEKKLGFVLDIAAETAAELSKMQDINQERLLALARDFIATCKSVQETLNQHVGIIGVSVPLERSSYGARLELEIQREKLRAVETRLKDAIAEIAQHQQQAPQQQPQVI